MNKIIKKIAKQHDKILRNYLYYADKVKTDKSVEPQYKHWKKQHDSIDKIIEKFLEGNY